MSRILVIEDDAGIRAMLERGLRVGGHEATMAQDVSSGRRAWSSDPFDLVLLDVMLPDGDGIDLLAERRAAGDGTPTVLLTAREEAELKERASLAGASAYLPKPFAYAELLACIRRLLGEAPSG
jgi:two-component system, OmpR family, response regulator QseB